MAKPVTGHHIGASDAKLHFSELLERVERGEEVTITRRGAPVARIVPVRKQHSREERAHAIASIRDLGCGLTLGGARLRDLIAEGRR